MKGVVDDIFKVPEGTEENKKKIFGGGTRCPDQDLNPSSLEYKSKA